jgi:hypothetical protein
MDPPVRAVPSGAQVAEAELASFSPEGDVGSDSSRFWLAGFLQRVLGRSGRHRRVGDRGAAMVEMAFVFSLLVMLLVGVVTTAIAFGEKNSIENAAREASRYAATYPAPEAPDTWQDWLETVRDVARGSAQGNLDVGVDGEYICVAHIGSGLKLEDVGGVESVSSGTCYDDGLSDPRVQVVTGRDTEISAAFFSIDVTLDAPVTARYERAEE